MDGPGTQQVIVAHQGGVEYLGGLLNEGDEVEGGGGMEATSTSSFYHQSSEEQLQQHYHQLQLQQQQVRRTWINA